MHCILVRMPTKVAVVTGSNKGVGLAIVRGLCKQFEGDVYLTARNEENGRRAVATLEAEGLNPKFHQLDIDYPESIEAIKHHLLDNYGGVDVEERDVAAHYEQQLGELCSCLRQLRGQWEQYLENLDQRHVFTAYQAQVVPASGRGIVSIIVGIAVIVAFIVLIIDFDFS